MSKTVITLTAIDNLMFDSFLVSRVLVIAPLRVARDTWPAEAKKWDHLSGLRISVAVGNEAERRMALTGDADVYVINRENVQWLVEKSRVPWKWDMLVVDELSSFKNPQAKRFKALMKIRGKIKRVVGLTGTPASNGLMDLFAEYRLIDKGVRLGRFITRYREEFFRPDKTNGSVVYSYKPLPFAEEEIYRRIGDITISMKSVDFLDMPEKVVSENVVYMSAREKKEYERLQKDLVLELDGEEVTAANAAALCQKLSQMANGAVYTDDGETKEFHSRKLDALEDMIEAANGKPVMVVYWFRSDLKRIEERLKEMGITFERLDGSGVIDRWNRGDIPVLLLSPASAGHGLNLQSGGSRIIWFGLTWSLELYQQTNARLWRQGQKNTVTIQHIVCRDTVDEDVLKALERKNMTQEGLISAVKARLTS